LIGVCAYVFREKGLTDVCNWECFWCKNDLYSLITILWLWILTRR